MSGYLWFVADREEFCTPDSPFFDRRAALGADTGYAADLPDPGPRWRVATADGWRTLHPLDRTVPDEGRPNSGPIGQGGTGQGRTEPGGTGQGELVRDRPDQSWTDQGWKVHVSATAEHAADTLAIVSAYCVARNITHKHLPGPADLRRRNSKNAERGASGKFITIYPGGEAELGAILGDLGPRLAGRPGAYILSDLRIGAGPLYVRYGGFRPRWTTVDGRRVHAIRAPDGRLVPDKRGASFAVPDGVPVPDVLLPHLRARKAGAGLPHRITGAIHFSNGGGVYRAEGGLVLKEARPHAGLDSFGRDAVARLRHEHLVLTALSGLPGVPAVHEPIEAWEHLFLPMQELPGDTLGRWIARCFPLEEDHSGYAVRATTLADRLDALVAGIHERGWVVGDLHPGNVLVDDADVPYLVDFEAATPIEADTPAGLGTPGFRAPSDRRGADIDRYALAAIRLALFVPLAPLRELDPAALDRQCAEAGLPDRVRTTLAGATRPFPGVEPVPVPPVDPRPALVRAILASATPDREDRLYPGDPAQFGSAGALGIGHGAAGVLWALHQAGVDPPAAHVDWLLSRAAHGPPGLWHGGHGIALVLDALGHADVADTILRTAGDTDGFDLAAGRAGQAAALLAIGARRGDHTLLDRAVRLARRIDAGGGAGAPGAGGGAGALGAESGAGARSGPGGAGAAGPGGGSGDGGAGRGAGAGRPGLLYGWSGPALLFVRLAEITGEAVWLDRAESVIARDLARCVPVRGGGVQVQDGRRTLPYLAHGGAGIAVAAAALAVHRPGGAAATVLPGLLAACRAAFTIYPSLMAGSAGLLVARVAAGADPGGHERLLSRHLIGYRGGLAVAGAGLRRLSMDVHTGGAGVLLALAYQREGQAPLPLLAPVTDSGGLTPVHQQVRGEEGTSCRTFSSSKK